MAFTKSIIIWAKDKSVVEKPVASFTANGKSISTGVEAVQATTHYSKADAPAKKVVLTYNQLALDCVVDESHTFSNEVTSYPVSSGFLVGEHVIKKNFMFSINGIITNISMPGPITVDSLTSSFSTVGKAVGGMMSRAVGPVIGSLIGSAAHMLDNSKMSGNPISVAFTQLQDLVRNGTIVHVATILGVYEECVLREVRIHQDVKTSTVLPVSLVFEQLMVIQPEGRIGFSIPNDQKKALYENKTASDTSLMLNMLTASGVNILSSIIK